MAKGLRQPTMKELINDNKSIFKTRVSERRNIDFLDYPVEIDKGLYVVIPRGTKAFQVVKIGDRNVYLDSPEFVEDYKKAEEVLKRFNASGKRNQFMKAFFDKYTSNN